MIWNEKYECMSRKELEELQLARLKAIVQKVYDRVPFYRDSLCRGVCEHRYLLDDPEIHYQAHQKYRDGTG